MRAYSRFVAITFLLGSFFLPPFLAAQTSAAAPNPWKWHTHADEKFMLALPSNWEVRENVTLGIYKIALVSLRPLKPNDVFRENINMVTENVDPSFQLKEYVNASVTGMTKALNQFQVLNSGELKGGYTPSQYLVYTQVAEQYDGVLKAIVFFFLKDGKAYSLTCTATDKTFDNYLSLFQQIGKSMVLPKSPTQ